MLVNVLVILGLAQICSGMTFRAYQRSTTSFFFPENRLPELEPLENNGVVLSGGGTRSYTYSLGLLQGLQVTTLLGKEYLVVLF